MTHRHILIGVSSCLRGEPVRYDGAHKRSRPVAESLCTQFSCVSICPETAIGLGIPRTPIILKSNTQHQVRAMIGNELDVTRRIQHYAHSIRAQLEQLSGFIFKSKSPSCGVNSAIVFDTEDYSHGIFTAYIREQFPQLPLCEESDLRSEDFLKIYSQRVLSYFDNKL